MPAGEIDTRLAQCHCEIDTRLAQCHCREAGNEWQPAGITSPRAHTSLILSRGNIAPGAKPDQKTAEKGCYTDLEEAVIGHYVLHSAAWSIITLRQIQTEQELHHMKLDFVSWCTAASVVLWSFICLYSPMYRYVSTYLLCSIPTNKAILKVSS